MAYLNRPLMIPTDGPYDDVYPAYKGYPAPGLNPEYEVYDLKTWIPGPATPQPAHVWSAPPKGNNNPDPAMYQPSPQPFQDAGTAGQLGAAPAVPQSDPGYLQYGGQVTNAGLTTDYAGMAIGAHAPSITSALDAYLGD